MGLVHDHDVKSGGPSSVGLSSAALDSADNPSFRKLAHWAPCTPLLPSLCHALLSPPLLSLAEPRAQSLEPPPHINSLENPSDLLDHRLYFEDSRVLHVVLQPSFPCALPISIFNLRTDTSTPVFNWHNDMSKNQISDFLLPHPPPPPLSSHLIKRQLHSF